MTTALLGLDIGTTACKGLLLAPDGAVLAEASAAQPHFSPQPGWAEADAGAWWENAQAVTRSLLAQVPGIAVRGVGVAGGGPAPLLLHKEGAPPRPPVPQNNAPTRAAIAPRQAPARPRPLPA